MADQATSAGGRSSIDPHPETPAAGAPASAGAPAAAAPTAAAETLPSGGQAAGEEAAVDRSDPGFGARGRMRRRLRFLRKARELAYRDLGGLVFEMQRLGERRDELVAAKLATLGAIDTELRALEVALNDRRALTILRESGIAACPRCAAIHGSEDRFCPSCGLAMESRADRPIAAVAVPAAPPAAGAGLPGAGFPGATPATAARPLFTAPPPAGSALATPPPPATAPASSPISRPAPPTPTPPPAPPRSSPIPPAPQAPPVTDERPTEIIRPADGSGGGKA